MKTIYFVRHGQSEGNAGPVWVDATSKLSAKGKEQARVVAERFTKLPVDIIISSTMDRAVETAQIIAERIDKKTEQSELFVEPQTPIYPSRQSSHRYLRSGDIRRGSAEFPSTRIPPLG